jgi:hypothetical protein
VRGTIRLPLTLVEQVGSLKSSGGTIANRNAKTIAATTYATVTGDGYGSASATSVDVRCIVADGKTT